MTHPFTLAVLGVLLVAGLVTALLWKLVRARNMHYWIGAHLAPTERVVAWTPDQPLDVFIAICDHYEPECYGASRETARARVQRWLTEYPEKFGCYTDVDGRPPLYTFFFPQDEYRPEYLDELKKLCDLGFGDVDIHLHHHNDTANQLHDKLEEFRQTLYHRHGLLRKDPRTGEIVYGFIHGNWALCNSRSDKQFCGVDQELTVLLQTGCYADFTLPSAPSDTQTRTINSIYYARDFAGRCKSHDVGIRARAGWGAPEEHLLMIQGALTLDWGSRRFGLIPRIENSDLHEGRPASLRRLKLWLDAGVCVAGRPDWRFVKLHTHGCKDGNIDELLGAGMQQFHAELAELHQRHPNFRYHYVTAWEMAQLVHQAEAGAALPQLPLPGIGAGSPQRPVSIPSR